MQFIRASILAISLLTTVSAFGSAQPRDPSEYFFDQHLGDFTEELENAQDQGKKGILIMFEMDDCPFCHRMKDTVLNQPDVQDFYKENFLIFSVDIEGDIELIDFQGRVTSQKDFAFPQNRVRATPVFQFFDLQGKPVKGARYTGATRDKEEFLLLGQFLAEGVYKKTSFSRYKREHRSK